MTASTYLRYLVLCATIIHPAAPAPAGNIGNVEDDTPDAFRKFLQFIHGEEFKGLIKEIDAELDSQNIACVSQHGQHWFFYQELECRYCGDVCPLDTQTDECIKYCSSYWEEVAQNKTLQAQWKKYEDLERTEEKYEAISITSIVIAVLGLLSICTFVILNRKWFAKKYKGLVDTFQKKTDVADADRTGYQPVPVQQRAAEYNETITDATHDQGERRESGVQRELLSQPT